ncbi:MAG TPA: response regulator transcription factor [Pseudonocardiaceae bacterium]
MRVLLLEDDEDLRFAIGFALRSGGLAVDEVGDLPAADAALAVNAYDCAVFDRLLPSGDALGYLRDRRSTGFTVPVLLLTALDAVHERIAGLEHADDYLVKPFAMAELIARVHSLCRRAPSDPGPVLHCGDLTVDTGRHEVRRAGVLLTLTGKEFTVLTDLVRGQGAALSRSDLVGGAWDELVEPASNVLDVVLAQLRRKLGPPPMIHTVRGIGYRIDPG